MENNEMLNEYVCPECRKIFQANDFRIQSKNSSRKWCPTCKQLLVLHYDYFILSSREVISGLRDELEKALSFIRGFEDDEAQEGINEMLKTMDFAMKKSELFLETPVSLQLQFPNEITRMRIALRRIWNTDPATMTNEKQFIEWAQTLAERTIKGNTP